MFLYTSIFLLQRTLQITAVNSSSMDGNLANMVSPLPKAVWGFEPEMLLLSPDRQQCIILARSPPFQFPKEF